MCPLRVAKACPLIRESGFKNKDRSSRPLISALIDVRLPAPLSNLNFSPTSSTSIQSSRPTGLDLGKAACHWDIRNSRRFPAKPSISNTNPSPTSRFRPGECLACIVFDKCLFNRIFDSSLPLSLSPSLTTKTQSPCYPTSGSTHGTYGALSAASNPFLLNSQAPRPPPITGRYPLPADYPLSLFP